MTERRILALTVIQPWTSLIALGIKPVENRDWPPGSRLQPGDFLAIHAGKAVDLRHWAGAYEMAERAGLLGTIPILDGLTPLLARGDRLKRAALKSYVERAVPYSSVLAVTTLDEVRTMPRPRDRWFVGEYGWYLRDVVPFAPIPCSGAQGLWALPDPVLATVRTQYRAARRLTPATMERAHARHD